MVVDALLLDIIISALGHFDVTIMTQKPHSGRSHSGSSVRSPLRPWYA